MRPATIDLKRWTNARALACSEGIQSFRSDPIDGPVAFFTVRHGVPRQHADLAALETYIAECRACRVERKQVPA